MKFKTPQTEAWTRRRWIKQFMLGSAVAIGASPAWRGRLLADISPGARRHYLLYTFPP